MESSERGRWRLCPDQVPLARSKPLGFGYAEGYRRHRPDQVGCRGPRLNAPYAEGAHTPRVTLGLSFFLLLLFFFIIYFLSFLFLLLSFHYLFSFLLLFFYYFFFFSTFCKLIERSTSLTGLRGALVHPFAESESDFCMSH